MARRKTLPGVDEAALAELAKGFPGNLDPARTGPAQTQASRDAAASAQPGAGQAREASGEGAKTGPSGVAPDSGAGERAPKARGRGLAAVAVLISVFALVAAAASLAPPELRPWLQATLGDNRVIDVLTGTRAEFDRRVSDVSSAIGPIRSDLGSVKSRLDAIEAVGGSSEAAARRVEAAEKGIAAVTTRLESIDGSVASALERMAAVEERSAASAKRVGELDRDVRATVFPRLGEFERALRTLQRMSAGAEKLFLIALRIRTATQTSAPFAKEVAAAQTIVVGDGDISSTLEVLAEHAATGVATVEQLRDRFNGRLAPRLRALARGAGQSWVAQVGDWLDLVFSASGGAKPRGAGDTTIIVALAQRNLARGQLSTAVDQLAQLNDASAAMATNWLQEARARLAVDEATGALMTNAFDRFVNAN